MTYFEEIFGFEPATVQPKTVPYLPLDDFRFWIAPASSRADQFCAKIEQDALAAELLGEASPEKVFLGDPDALARFRQVVPAPVVVTPTFTAPALVKFASKVESLRKRAPEHKQAVADILAKFRRKLGGRPNDQEAWERLQKSCENYLQQTLVEVN
jgi:hypothetical protein